MTTTPDSTTTNANPTARRREHPFINKASIIKGESAERYFALVDRIATELQPQDYTEWLFVEMMAQAKWREIRYISMRAAAESQTMVNKSEFIANLKRYERSRSREYKSFLRGFIEWRDFRREKNVKLPNEPENSSLRIP